MKYSKLKILFALLLLSCSINTYAQERVLIHSHNDYEQIVPFYQAYAQKAASIEADIFAQEDGRLLVAHSKSELSTAQTIDELYIEPLVKLFAKNGNRAWKSSDYTLSLLVDLKTPATPTLDLLIEKLEKYPNVFDVEKNPLAVRVIISGNRPDSKDFHNYSKLVSFDGDRLDYTAKELERISMISFSLSANADWNGKGSFKTPHYKKVMALIDGVHALGKPIRFWSSPDEVNAWNMLHNMGVDYINTDKPEACAAFFDKFENKNYEIYSNPHQTNSEVTSYKKLDRATAGFKGFKNDELQLSKGIEVYTPTYKNDGADTKIKNIIFLIGDGMGLNQLQTAATINNPNYINRMGLTILNMKYMGLQNTSARDTYTTDSAGAGSALATGELHNNRHISMSPEGVPYPSFTDYMHNAGYACGVITLGNLADATPAAYYGHAIERDDSDIITDYLLDGKLTLLSGSGIEVFTKRQDKKDILSELKKQYRISTQIDDINADNKKVICVDERMGAAANEASLSLLADATKQSIDKLVQANDKGFFLMVEGAKIDYAGHAKSLPGSIVETLSFDLAVKAALEFADSNGETLVVVTGDHETGGLVLVDGNFETGHITARHTSDDHTAMMLPVFAYGPGAKEFIGVYKNTELFDSMMKVMNFKKTLTKKARK